MTALDDVRQAAQRYRERSFSAIQKQPNIDISHQVLLYVEGLSVSFDGFKALNDLNLYINDGELRCLIGANGAGKTTLMDVITGKTRPDTGDVYFGQTIDLLGKTEAEIAQLGIGRKFQKPTVFEEQSVFANLELAMKVNKGITSTLFARLTPSELDWISQVLDTIGLKPHYTMKAGAL